MCPTCDMSPLCFANPETCRAQRCHVHYVTFVQSLFTKSWTKMDMSPKCVCPFSTKTAENNWKLLCTGKAWLIVVTWQQKVQMTKNWTCHLPLYTAIGPFLPVPPPVEGFGGGLRRLFVYGVSPCFCFVCVLPLTSAHINMVVAHRRHYQALIPLYRIVS